MPEAVTHEGMPSHEDDSFSHEDTFVDLLGSPGRVKILETFLTHAETTLTAGDVAELADVSESTFSRNVDKFLDLELVESAGKVGNTKLYTLNTESPLAEDLARARYHLRNRAASLDPDLWGTADDGGSPRPGTDDAELAGELVTRLFDETTDDRERTGAAEKLAVVADRNPEAVVDVAPALVEATDDDDPQVAEYALEAVMHVVEEYPDVLDDEDTSRLLTAVAQSRSVTHDSDSGSDSGFLDRLKAGRDEVRSRIGVVAHAGGNDESTTSPDDRERREVTHPSETTRDDRPTDATEVTDHDDS